MHLFEHQESRQTLAQGIAEYYDRNHELVRGDQLSVEAREFFRSHDAVHVVYGCGISLSHEAIVKVCSVFGTTAGVSVLRGYRLHESIDIYKRLNPQEVVSTTLASVVLVPRAIFRCLRQRKRWPWSDFSAHLESLLCELRAGYGICVPGGVA